MGGTELLPNPHCSLKGREALLAGLSTLPVILLHHHFPLLGKEGWVFANGAGGGEEASQGNRHFRSPLSGATEKPYLVEEAVSYNELDYVSVSPASAVGVPT